MIDKYVELKATDRNGKIRVGTVALALIATVIIVVEGAAIYEQKTKQVRQTQSARNTTTEGGHIRNGSATRDQPIPTRRTQGTKDSPKPSNHVQNGLSARKSYTDTERKIIAALATGKYDITRRPLHNSRGMARYDIRLVDLGVFKLTAYTAGHESTGKRKGDQGYGHTYSGRMVTKDVTVAACLSQLPTGTLLYIEGVGVRRVDDKGSAVHRNRLDVYIPTLHEAKHFGVIHRKVYIIKGVTL